MAVTPVPHVALLLQLWQAGAKWTKSLEAGRAGGSPSVQETANMSAPDPGWLREVAGSQCRSVQKVGRVHTCRRRAHRDLEPAQKQCCRC